MKRLISSIVFLSTLFLLLSCQDNSITNPVSTLSVNKNAITNNSNSQNIITLYQKIKNPDRINDSFLLEGEIRYSETLLDQNTGSNNSPFDAMLNISIKGTFKDESPDYDKIIDLSVTSKSERLITLNPDGKIEFVESYPVTGSTDDMQLICNFELNGNVLQLTNISLISATVR